MTATAEITTPKVSRGVVYGAVAELFKPLQAAAWEEGAEYVKLKPEFKPPREYLIDGPAGTGKSHGVLRAVLHCCTRWPGIRVLFVRQVRSSLAESILTEWEEGVLGEGHPAIIGTADRERRMHYSFPKAWNPYTESYGRSRVVCAGLDNPVKLFSTQWDIIVMFEAIEVIYDSWLKSFRGNRNFKMPWQWRLAETNPGPARHWLNLRPEEPESIMVRLLSIHQDNPAFYDHATGEWTEKGADYIENLEALPEGTTKDSHLYGKWVSEGGLVWPQFSRSIHCISYQQVPDDADWYVASMDFGYSHAGVVNVWAIDSKLRCFRVAEVYKSGWTIEEWADAVCQLDQMFNLAALVCDSARPDDIKSLNLRLARHRGQPIRGIAQRCYKKPDTGGGARQLFGLDLVREMLTPTKGWRPSGKEELAEGVRLFFVDNVHVFGIDLELQKRRKPISTIEEIESYAFPKDEDGNPMAERPDKDAVDDGCDTIRYLATWLDRRQKAKPPEKKYEPGTNAWRWAQRAKKQAAEDLNRRLA